VRDWVARFNTDGPNGLIDRHGPGASLLWSAAQLRALVGVVERGPIPAVHGVVRWRLVDLVQWIWEAFRISVSVQTISRQLRRLEYRKLSARPRHHAQAAGAIDDFKKAFPQRWVKSRARRGSSLLT
jgi:transposase